MFLNQPGGHFAPVFGVEPYVFENRKDNWSGREDSNLRPPGPESGVPRYLLEYRANIFV